MNLDELFLDFSADKLKQFTTRIEDCLGRLSDDQIWARQADSDNSVGNLVLHLCGNVRQWIGSGVAGIPDARDRDAEFAARGGMTSSDLVRKLRSAMEDALPALRNQTTESLTEVIHVQTYTLSKLEAIYHVVEHFAGHTGQIIFATKLIVGEDLGYYKHLSSLPTPVEASSKSP